MTWTDTAELALALSAPEDIAAARLCSSEEQRKKPHKGAFPHSMRQNCDGIAERLEEACMLPHARLGGKVGIGGHTLKSVVGALFRKCEDQPGGYPMRQVSECLHQLPPWQIEA